MTTLPRADVLDALRRAVGPDDSTDGQVLERFVAARDEAAFRELVRRHGPMVLGVCRRLIGHADDADDAFQAVFLVLARKGESVRPRSGVGNWLYGVAYRTALDVRSTARRRAAREKQVDDMPHPQTSTSSGEPDLKELLDAELARLPEKYRLAVVLCELEGRSRKEVAQQLGVPQGTVSSRLAAARKILAARLTRRGLACAAAALTLPVEAAVPPSLASTTTRIALTLSGASPAALAISERVVKAMFLAKLKVTTAVLLALCASTFGILRLGTGPAEARPAESRVAPVVAVQPPDVPVNAVQPPVGVPVVRPPEVKPEPKPEPQPEPLPGWQLRMLIRTTPGPIAFSPDGKRIATGGSSKVELWVIGSKNEPEVIAFDQNETVLIHALAFSPDGRLLAMGDSGGTLRIWNVAEKQELVRQSIHQGEMRAVAFSPDGKLLATAGKDGAVVLLTVAGKEIARQQPDPDEKPKGAPRTVAFSPDGRQVAIGDADGTVSVLLSGSLKTLWQFTGQRGAVSAVSFSPDAKTLVLSGGDGTVYMLDAATGKELRRLMSGTRLTTVAYSPDGRTIASAGSVTVEKNTAPGVTVKAAEVVVKLWDPATGKEIASQRTTFSSARMIAFSPNGKHLALSGPERPGVANKWGGMVWVWERSP